MTPPAIAGARVRVRLEEATKLDSVPVTLRCSSGSNRRCGERQNHVVRPPSSSWSPNGRAVGEPEGVDTLPATPRPSYPADVSTGSSAWSGLCADLARSAPTVVRSGYVKQEGLSGAMLDLLGQESEVLSGTATRTPVWFELEAGR
jgi:hypothetical protein